MHIFTCSATPPVCIQMLNSSNAVLSIVQNAGVVKGKYDKCDDLSRQKNSYRVISCNRANNLTPVDIILMNDFSKSFDSYKNSPSAGNWFTVVINKE